MAEFDSETALLVVDVQNDFADPDGSLYVPGGEDVVPFVDAQIERALSAGTLVVYTQDWHPEHTHHFKQDGGIWPVHCVHDTWGAAFHPDLRIEGPTIRKGVNGKDGYSGFSVRDPHSGNISATALESLLHEHDIERLVVAGLATDYCVVETTLDARALDFPVTVLARGIRAVDLSPGDGERAIRRMWEAGATLEE